MARADIAYASLHRLRQMDSISLSRVRGRPGVRSADTRISSIDPRACALNPNSFRTTEDTVTFQFWIAVSAFILLAIV